MNIGIIGYGEIGRALEKVLLSARHEVAVWDIDPEKVHGTKSLAGIASHADFLFLCVPSWAVRDTAVSLHPHLTVRPNVVVVSLAKGVETGTRMMVDEILLDALPQKQQFALLGGPMLAEELMADLPGIAVVASPAARTREAVAALFAGSSVRTELTADRRSVAVASVLKNVYALALGIVDGLGWGGNQKGWFTAAAEDEMLSVGVALGAKPAILRGAAGFGDFIATAFSPYSRNRTAGETFVQSGTCDPSSESARSLASLVTRIGRTRTPLSPILATLAAVIVHGKDVRRTFGQFNVPQRP
jgi:glycerol-3-phosphate dehydrogenase (NAD(P)+)